MSKTAIQLFFVFVMLFVVGCKGRLPGVAPDDKDEAIHTANKMNSADLKEPIKPVEAYDESELVRLAPTPISGRMPDALPKAVVYKTNGDYNNNVFINIAGDGHILTFPAPTDVDSASCPIVLKDGWLLDRRGGIGSNSVFLNITYSEYHQLPATPSLATLRTLIMPSAKVVEYKNLPINLNEALSDTTAVNTMLSQL